MDGLSTFSIRWAVPTPFGTLRLNDPGFVEWLHGQNQPELAALVAHRAMLERARDDVSVGSFRIGRLVMRSKTLAWRILINLFSLVEEQEGPWHSSS